jgi:multidrug efflux pump subunit AcrB
LRELVTIEPTITDKSLYHKNLMPVTYVIGDVAGVVESPVYAILKMNQALRALDTREFGGREAELKILNAVQPFTDQEPAIKWDGEWHITLEVFRGALHAFFTATSMIGFMAGAGIVVRNSIILVDFIEQRLREGLPLAEAVVEAGMVRFRPILLTALAVVVGASVILTDPIFQGLAISLMAGSLVSMIIAPVAVPLLYFMANTRTSSRRL